MSPVAPPPPPPPTTATTTVRVSSDGTSTYTSTLAPATATTPATLTRTLEISSQNPTTGATTVTMTRITQTATPTGLVVTGTESGTFTSTPASMSQSNGAASSSQGTSANTQGASSSAPGTSSSASGAASTTIPGTFSAASGTSTATPGSSSAPGTSSNAQGSSSAQGGSTSQGASSNATAGPTSHYTYESTAINPNTGESTTVKVTGESSAAGSTYKVTSPGGTTYVSTDGPVTSASPPQSSTRSTGDYLPPSKDSSSDNSSSSRVWEVAVPVSIVAAALIVAGAIGGRWWRNRQKANQAREARDAQERQIQELGFVATNELVAEGSAFLALHRANTQRERVVAGDDEAPRLPGESDAAWEARLESRDAQIAAEAAAVAETGFYAVEGVIMNAASANKERFYAKLEQKLHHPLTQTEKDVADEMLRQYTRDDKSTITQDNSMRILPNAPHGAESEVDFMEDPVARDDDFSAGVQSADESAAMLQASVLVGGFFRDFFDLDMFNEEVAERSRLGVGAVSGLAIQGGSAYAVPRGPGPTVASHYASIDDAAEGEGPHYAQLSDSADPVYSVPGEGNTPGARQRVAPIPPARARKEAWAAANAGDDDAYLRPAALQGRDVYAEAPIDTAASAGDQYKSPASVRENAAKQRAAASAGFYSVLGAPEMEGPSAATEATSKSKANKAPKSRQLPPPPAPPPASPHPSAAGVANPTSPTAANAAEHDHEV